MKMKVLLKKVSELRRAILNKQSIAFEYTNQRSERRLIKGNVIHVYYKWYAWYAFVHDFKNDRNLMFKIVRMDDVNLTGDFHTISYNVKELLSNYNQANENQRIELQIEYFAENEKLITEYFGGKIIQSQESVIRRKINIKEDDFFMFSLILGFGDKLKVVSPHSYREKVARHLEEALVKNYLNGDI